MQHSDVKAAIRVTRRRAPSLFMVFRTTQNFGRRGDEPIHEKTWCRSSLDRLIKKIDAGLLPVDGVIGRIHRWPRPVRTAANVARVKELICSQEDAPGTHKSPQEIERQTGISRSSILRIAKLDLNLKTFKRISGQKLNNDSKQNCFKKCQRLLQRSRIKVSLV